jgi:hypothetical protein
MMMFVYAVLVFLVLRFSVTLFNFLSNPKLGYAGKHFTDGVSIIVLPGSVEQVERSVNAIENQDYKHTEVIVQQNENLEGLVYGATGKYLLFLAAGTTIHYGLINNLIYRLKVFDLAVLSLVPTDAPVGFIERCIYPLSDFLLLNLLPLRLVRLSNQPAFSGGNSDCMFFRASLCKQYNWHKEIGDKSSVGAIKLVKQKHLKAEILLANKFVYNQVGLKNPADLSAQLLLNFGNSILVASLYLVLVVVGPIVVLISFNPVLVVLPFGLIFLSRVMIAFLTAQNPFVQVLLHPLQMLLLFVLTFKAIWICILRSIKPEK